MMFSKDYKTYQDWLSNFQGSKAYRQRIINAHKRFPRANLTQLRGHPSKTRKPVSQLKKSKRKKSPVRLIVIQGNAVSQDKTETGKDVYFEAHVRIADRNVDKFTEKIFKDLDAQGIKVFRSDKFSDRINISLTGERTGKVMSQKKFLRESVDKVKSEMHAAKRVTFGHHKRNRPAHDEYKRRYEDGEF